MVFLFYFASYIIKNCSWQYWTLITPVYFVTSLQCLVPWWMGTPEIPLPFPSLRKLVCLWGYTWQIPPVQTQRHHSSLSADIPITCHGFTLLDSSVGPRNFGEDVFHSRLYKLKASLSVLLDLRDSQLETALLHLCLAFHSEPACPATSQTPLLSLIFSLDRPRSWLREVQCHWSWLKASFPSNLGGFNLLLCLHFTPQLLSSPPQYHFNSLLKISSISFLRLYQCLCS